jgi:hypothetical protein
MAKVCPDRTPASAPYAMPASATGVQDQVGAEVSAAGAGYSQAAQQALIDLVHDLRQVAINCRQAK